MKLRASKRKRPSTYQDATTQVETAEPITTFTVFRKLPVELRLKIWEYALPGRRVLVLKFYDDYNGKNHIECANPPPVISKVCRESRALMKTLYQPSFNLTPWLSSGIFLTDIEPERYSGPTVLFSPTLDTVFFAAHEDFESFVHANECWTRSIIQSLAVWADAWDEMGCRSFATFLMRFTDLKELIIVRRDDELWQPSIISAQVVLQPCTDAEKEKFLTKTGVTVPAPPPYSQAEIKTKTTDSIKDAQGDALRKGMAPDSFLSKIPSLKFRTVKYTYLGRHPSFPRGD
jgi:hypothetical protein